MRLIALLRPFLPTSPLRLVLGLSTWGILSMVVVPLANIVYDLGPGAGLWWVLLVGHVFGLVGMLWLRRWGSWALLVAHTGLVADLYRRAGEAVLDAELTALRQQGSLRGRLDADLEVVEREIQSIFLLIHSSFRFGAATLLVLCLDSFSVWVWCLTFGGTALAVWPDIAAGRARRAKVAALQTELRQAADNLVHGVIAVRMDREVGDAVSETVMRRAEAVERASSLNLRKTEETYLTGMALLYLLGYLPTAFSDPAASHLNSEAAFGLMLMLGQGLSETLGAMQSLPRVLHAVESVDRVTEALAPIARPPAPPISSSSAWSTLALRGVCYRYGEGFVVGPIDLALAPGELVFVTGGNGSGKSTLMRALLGLVPPSMGHIEWDGRVVVGERWSAYRQLFTALFNEVHLFEGLYGIDAPAAEVRALLRRLGLEGIVDLDRRRFTTLSLSTGQRKRLAMVVALLEDRPICVFDEWTANLDPETTQFYYDELLPELIRRGKTVVAVSHDDRYFDRARRVLVMDQGRIVAVRDQGPRAAEATT